jgi:hypothetical protein
MSYDQLSKILNSIDMSHGSLADLQTAANIIDLLYLDQDKISESADFRALDETGKMMYATMAAKTGTIFYAVLLEAVKDNDNINKEAAEQFKKDVAVAAGIVSVVQGTFMSKVEVFAESGGKISSALALAKHLGPLIEGYSRAVVVINDNEKWLRELVGFTISTAVFMGAASLATRWIPHPAGQIASLGAAALRGGALVIAALASYGLSNWGISGDSIPFLLCGTPLLCKGEGLS